MEKDLDAMIVEMVAAADAYCARENIARTTLGRFIMNDGGFFDGLIFSGNCTIKTYRKVMQWFEDKCHKEVPKESVNDCRL